MANYILRVEFLNESKSKYKDLRDELRIIGFTKRVTSNDKIEYRLPNGNYLLVSSKSASTILNAVKIIAEKIDKNPLILLTEVREDRIYWDNLQKC